MSSVSDLRKMFGGGTSAARQFGMIFVLVALLVFFNWRTHSLTLSSANIIQLGAQYSYILILAIGMVLVIIAGHIDLSVGSIAAFVGVSVALLMHNSHLPWYLGIVAGLVIGALAGAWQGFWVAFVGVPAFIVTLAGMLIFRGANQFLGNSTAVPVGSTFQTIGAGYLPTVGPDTGKNNLTLLIGLLLFLSVVYREMRLRRVQSKLNAAMAPLWVSFVKLGILGAIVAYATLLFAGGRTGSSLPISALILAGLVVIYSYVARNTIIGRNVYAVGGNRLAANLSGVNTRRVNFLVMTNMGMLAGLAGMIWVARSGSSGAQDGLGWELDAIAAVFVGGAAISGGVGTVIGSIVGGLVMAVLNNGLILLGVGSDRTQVIKGMVLLGAVALDVYNKNQGRPSLIGLMSSRLRSQTSPVELGPVNPSSEELPLEADARS